MAFYKHGRFAPLAKVEACLSQGLPEPRNLDEADKAVLSLLRHMYIDEDMTARQICENFGAPYTPEIQKLFFVVFGAKGKGWGGARR